MSDFIAIFQKTLINGNAYITILKGLWITVAITLASLLLGTCVAIGICALRRSKIRILSWIAAGYISILRGSPVLLLLMLMYYVIFSSSPLSAVSIAIITFGLNVSAHLAEVMRAALSAIDPKQIEAARTLGFSKFQAFRWIALPQSIQIAKPVYQSVIVNLVQWTSVAGYITIVDLTRVINTMSARTMQPLFMILIGMALYLGLAYLCYGLFALSDKLTAWLQRRREV